MGSKFKDIRNGVYSIIPGSNSMKCRTIGYSGNHSQLDEILGVRYYSKLEVERILMEDIKIVKEHNCSWIEMCLVAHRHRISYSHLSATNESEREELRNKIISKIISYSSHTHWNNDSSFYIPEFSVDKTKYKENIDVKVKLIEELSGVKTRKNGKYSICYSHKTGEWYVIHCIHGTPRFSANSAVIAADELNKKQISMSLFNNDFAEIELEV